MLSACWTKIYTVVGPGYYLHKTIIMSISSSSTRTNNPEAIVNPAGQILAADEHQAVRGNADGELGRDLEKGPNDGETKDPNMVSIQ